MFYSIDNIIEFIYILYIYIYTRNLILIFSIKLQLKTTTVDITITILSPLQTLVLRKCLYVLDYTYSFITIDATNKTMWENTKNEIFLLLTSLKSSYYSVLDNNYIMQMRAISHNILLREKHPQEIVNVRINGYGTISFMP